MVQPPRGSKNFFWAFSNSIGKQLSTRVRVKSKLFPSLPPKTKTREHRTFPTKTPWKMWRTLMCQTWRSVSFYFFRQCSTSWNFLWCSKIYIKKTQNFRLHLAKNEKFEKKKHISALPPKSTRGSFIMVDLLKQQRLKSVSKADSLFLTGYNS